MAIADQLLDRSAVRRFLFSPVDARAAALLRIELALLAAVVFAPAADAHASELLQGRSWAALIEAMARGAPAWIGLLVLLAGFGAGRSARGLGLPAALLMAVQIPIEGRFPGRFVAWFAFTAFVLLRSDRALRPFGRRQTAADAGVAGPIWPIRLIQLQVSILYGVNALAKLSPAYLRGETLAAMSSELENFRVDLTHGTFPLFGLAVPLALAAAASVACEATLAIGFWFRRARWAVAALGVCFHVVLTLVVEIHFLDVVAVALYSAFLLPLERRGTTVEPGARDEPRRAAPW